MRGSPTAMPLSGLCSSKKQATRVQARSLFRADHVVYKLERLHSLYTQARKQSRVFRLAESSPRTSAVPPLLS